MKIEYEIGNKYSGFTFQDNGYCLIERVSPYTGDTNELRVKISKKQYMSWIDGTSIQNAFRNLTVDEREFILTGLLGDEFEKALGTEEKDLYDSTT